MDARWKWGEGPTFEYVHTMLESKFLTSQAEYVVLTMKISGVPTDHANNQQLSWEGGLICIHLYEVENVCS